MILYLPVLIAHHGAWHSHAAMRARPQCWELFKGMEDNVQK